MASTLLAEKFGLSAAPVGNGGTNYANGASYTVAERAGNVAAVQQIKNYLDDVNGVANPQALYVVSSGNNDLIFFANQGPDWLANNPNYLRQQAVALAAEVATLQTAGARTIIVPNFFSSAVLAGSGGDIAGGSDTTTYARSVSYGADIWSSLVTAGVHFIPADFDSVFRYVVHNPTLFGFTASSALAASGPALSNPFPYNTALTSVLTPAQQQDYLFIDGKHLTTAGQTIEADYLYSLLTAPSQISLLAESAVQSGLVHAQTIQGQIDLSQQHRGTRGLNVWGSAGAYELKIDNATGFTNDSGTPFYGAMGVDYLTRSGVVVGAAFTAGKQTQGFSSGGSFDQEVEAPSLYAAYKAEAIWGNAVATYGFLQNDIERQVTLGRFTELNHADANGHTLSLALRGGYDCSLGQKFTTGPVLGVILQQVNLDSFTETGTSNVTALSFGSQTRDSFVSQLGWRASMDLGRWKPFVEAEWNHEWAAKDRTITASLTSVSAPSYSMDAVPITPDWGTASLGTSWQLTPQVMLRGVASTVFFNSQVTSYGGEVGLSVSF
jgi:outer membrane lipase/esterase